MPEHRLRRAVLQLVVTAAALFIVGTGVASANNPGQPHYPDLQTIIPTDQFSIFGSGDTREFRYTHDIYNAGPGPLEIQPQFSQASGNYQGTQLIYTHDANNTWSLASTRSVPDSFVYHAAHGHFHFPLAAFGLYAVAADGGIGAPVAISPKNGFCIGDSYILNNTVPHAGTFI